MSTDHDPGDETGDETPSRQEDPPDWLAFGEWLRARGYSYIVDNFAFTILRADGTSFGSGLKGNDDSVVVGHLVVVKCASSGRVWDAGEGSTVMFYDRARQQWYPGLGSHWDYVKDRLEHHTVREITLL